MNWMDILVTATLIFSVVKGYLDGFVLSVLNISGLAAAILAARFYCGKLAEYLMANTPFYDRLYNAVLKGLGDSGFLSKGSDPSGLSFPKAVTDMAVYREALQMGGSAVTANIAGSISTAIFYIASVLLIFVAVKIIFAILTGWLNALVELPVLKQFNKAGGMAVGFLKGVLGLMIFFALLVPLTAIFPLGWLAAAIDRSAAAGYFYRYNFIIPWFMDVIAKMFYRAA